MIALRPLVWAPRYRAIATPEQNHQTQWQTKFLALMTETHFLPGGRILANAGRCGNNGGLSDPLLIFINNLKTRRFKMAKPLRQDGADHASTGPFLDDNDPGGPKPPPS